MDKKILYFNPEIWDGKPWASHLSEQEYFDVDYISTPKELFTALETTDKIYDLFMLSVIVPIVSFDESDWNRLTNSQKRGLDDGMKTGYVLGKIIRQTEKYKKVPIVFHETDCPKEMVGEADFHFSSLTSYSDVTARIKEILSGASMEYCQLQAKNRLFQYT
ncbi:hypothetical protein FACS1894176_10850 [Bacteroidia bacterium]|nr:hypothetical protein FACS1894176_10850 [Bacteroidia bacterium]